ncbi:hypothetical protein CC86DRAFT_464288 [Ophiobolus disseminans]|uniref:RRM domain-containing protein n=1 Tax=Ophiobolus disseminans TaxID=1469910 RepID=A0A6A7A916_9PLEO|nr:hypothetical protein CC86DRAFT_464288 [Ophiobolus disseminans]
MPEPLAPPAHSPHLSAASKESVVATDAMSAHRPGRALFSTQLGDRPHRLAPGPPYPPIVVRSGSRIAAVAEAAMYWRGKFPRQAMGILPGCDWQIEDFWDAKDIQLDTREHYLAVLKFLSEQNVVWARNFATEWFRAHPEHAAKTVGQSNMASMCDPTNPQDIVNKVFIYGESEKHPPAFLWQAALTMRTTMLEMRAEQKKSTPPDDTKTAAGAPPAKATSKANRKVTRSRPQRLTASTEPSPPTAPSKQHVAHPPKRAPSYGTSQPGTHHGQPMGAIMAHMPPFAMASPNVGTQPLYSVNGQRFDPSFAARMAFNAYSENRSRVNSGSHAPRLPSGTMSNTHTPHFNNAALAMGLPGIAPQHPGQYGQMSPSVHPAQLSYPSINAPGIVPGIHVQGSNMPPMYTQQGFYDRTPRGMGDMTNNAQYPQNMPPHVIAMQQQGNRRNSVYGNSGGGLYDPYNGTKHGFGDNKKTDRGGHADQPGRSRKFSAADNRPRTGSYSYNRTDTRPTSDTWYPQYGPKSRRLDNPQVINDKVYGCSEKWIGPENNSVNELFVNDLFDDVSPEEVMGMFTHMVAITPLRAHVTSTSTGNRSHAFVTFHTAADARKALNIVRLHPQVRNVPVRVTVPRRFFQMPLDSVNQPHPYQQFNKPVETRDTRNVARLPSQDEGSIVTNPEEQDGQSMYSPQDVRSGLPKQTSRKASEVDLSAGGSPENRKMKMRQDSPTEEPKIQLDEPIEEETILDDVAESLTVLKPATMTEGASEATALAGNPARATQPAKSMTSLEVSSTSSCASNAKDQTSHPTDVQPLADGAKVAIEELFSRPPDPEQTPAMARAEPESREVLEEVEPTDAAVEVSTQPTYEVPQTSQGSTEVQQAEHKEPIVVDNKSVPETAVSDDGVVAESSFISAQEDVAVLRKSSVNLRLEPGIANHGSERSVPSETEKLSHEDSASRPIYPTSEVILPPSTTSAPAKHKEVASTNTTDMDVMDTTTSIKDAKDDQDTSVLTSDVTTVSTASVQPSGDVMKKSGPQQTPSLNPFARKPKVQRHKEKVLTKKEKKKLEQEEKAAKARTGKAASASDPEDQATTLTSAGLEADAESTAEVSKTGPATDDAADSATSTGEGKNQAAVVVTLDQASKDESKNDVSGKQTGGTTTTIIPNETGSVTLKAEVAHEAPTAQDLSTATALLTLASSPERDIPARPDDGMHESILAKHEVKVDDLSTVPKKKKAIPAIANLILQPSSTPKRGSQTSSTATVSPTNNSTINQNTLSNMSPVRRESNAASVSSSVTLNMGDTAVLSPSPTAENFFTPLQTPATIPTTAQDQAPKAKKKKNKKKKKAAATVTVEASGTNSPAASIIASHNGTTAVSVSNCSPPSSGADTDSPSHGPNPFGEQMSHIDAIRKEAKNPDSFYNRINRSREEETAKNEKHDKDYEQLKGSANLANTAMRDIQAYMKENPSIFEFNN